MSNIWSVMRKEFARFFKDKRMVVSSLLLPGLMIYLVYSIMGSAMGSQFNTEDDYKYKIEAVNMPETVEPMFTEDVFEVTNQDTFDLEAVTNAINEKKVDAIVVFGEDFDGAIADFQGGDLTALTQVEIYYNDTITASSTAYSMVKTMMNGMEESIVDLVQVNAGDKQYDLATDKDMASFLMAMLMPMLMMAFLFSGSMAVAPESIAGEKERGTMATLLVTPVKRSQLAIGKILSLSVMALCCGLSSFIGVIFAMPQYMSSVMGTVNVQVYRMKEYGATLLVIVASVLLIVALISVISAYASSVKEASTYVSPIMIVSMLLGITTMFGSGAMTQPYVYLIPLFNSVQCFSAIFSFDMNMVNILLTLGSNIVYAVILGFILTRMFNSEKIMFKR